MGRAPCCDSDANVKKGPWTTEEDEKLREYIEENGAGNWRNLPKLAGLNRCGKSCRLRWANYLRPDIKRGKFSEKEEQMIIHFHSVLGNKWSNIAARLPGRTDNEIKNYWNTNLRKKLLKMGIDPVTHRPRTDLNLLASVPNLIAAAANLGNLTANPFVNAFQLPNQLQLLQTLIQLMATNNSPPNIDAMSLLGSPFLNGSLGPQNQNLMALQHLQNNLLDFPISGTEVLPPPMNYGTEVLPAMNYGSCSSEGGLESNGTGTSTSYIATATAASTPSLISASPETSITDQVRDPVNSISSPTSTSFEAWDGLNLDDLDGDFGWKDILNQISWSDGL